MSEERRCPNCGALVSPDGAWCGQCYSPLRSEPEAEPVLETARSVGSEPEVGGASAGSPIAEPASAATGSTVTPIQAREGEPSWPCPVCGNRNPIEIDACAACGTPFGRLFQEPERRVEIPPRRALAWSLLLPGLGHVKVGRVADGIARAVLFAWTTITVVLLLSSRSGKGGLGSTAGLFALFFVASLLLYGLSAIDTYRIASGERELVTSRILLWGSAALMLVAAVVATLVTLPAVRGG